jgi:hypothetical protein
VRGNIVAGKQQIVSGRVVAESSKFEGQPIGRHTDNTTPVSNCRFSPPEKKCPHKQLSSCATSAPTSRGDKARRRRTRASLDVSMAENYPTLAQCAVVAAAFKILLFPA